MRLDKYISTTTDYSRKDVKRLLKEGVVSVDGTIEKSPSRHILPDQTVSIDEIILAQPGPRYFMLHKPVGYVCATKDGEHPIVLDLLDEPNKEKLQIAGRLDIDTTGLVLITDDGKWNHAITSPNRQCHKTYYVCTAETISDETIDKFAKGLILEGERQRTKPATLDVLYANEARLTISEGKYHQIKRMFGAVGNRVVELHRERIGNIILDPALEEGEYRPLTPAEIENGFK